MLETQSQAGNIPSGMCRCIVVPQMIDDWVGPKHIKFWERRLFLRWGKLIYCRILPSRGWRVWIMYKPIDAMNIIPSEEVQGYCTLPYPDHPEGCPNHGHERFLSGIREDLRFRFVRECPPAMLEYLVLDYESPLYVIFEPYPVGMDADRRMNDPETKLSTLGQFYNLRYWQGAARKHLYREAERFLDDNPGTIVDLCPEAHGVNLLTLMYKELGIALQFHDWPPKQHDLDLVKYQICLGGYPAGNPLRSVLPE
jgi:hypothetical protein